MFTCNRCQTDQPASYRVLILDDTETPLWMAVCNQCASDLDRIDIKLFCLPLDIEPLSL